MEKCGKVWRRRCGTAAGHEVVVGDYSIPGASAASEMRACSACVGDYEDPERTAWTPEDEEDERREGAELVGTEEFPAEE